MIPEWSKPMDIYSPCAVFHNHVDPEKRAAACFTQFYFLSDRGCVMCLYKGRNGSNSLKKSSPPASKRKAGMTTPMTSSDSYL